MIIAVEEKGRKNNNNLCMLTCLLKRLEFFLSHRVQVHLLRFLLGDSWDEQPLQGSRSGLSCVGGFASLVCWSYHCLFVSEDDAKKSRKCSGVDSIASKAKVGLVLCSLLKNTPNMQNKAKSITCGQAEVP